MSRKPRLTFTVDGNFLNGALLAFFLLFSSCSDPGFGQNNHPDSPIKILPLQINTAWVDQLNNRSALCIADSRKDSALYYSDLALAGANQLNYARGAALACSRKSQIARHFDNDIILSRKFSEEALRYFQKAPDNRGIDTVYYNLFRASLAECRYEEATDYSDKLYQYARIHKDQNEIYLSLTCMFELNRVMGNYEKCLSYAQELYEIATRADNRQWLASALWNLAQLYTSMEDFPEALNNYRRAFEIRTPDIKNDWINSDKEAWFEMEYAEAFSHMLQFDSAWYYYQKFKPDEKDFKGLYRISTGEYYFLRGNYHEALEQFDLGLYEHRMHNDVNGVQRSLFDLSRTYLALGNAPEAIQYGYKGLEIAQHTLVNVHLRDGYKILSDAYDRLGQADSSNFYFRKYAIVKDVIMDAQSKARLAAYRYEQRLGMMKKEKQIQEIQLQKETWLKNILIGSILLLLLLAFFVIRNIILKRKYEARRRELAENELQIQMLESEKSHAVLLQQKSALEMKALRAQMNPHFIFNCLNSINQFIVKNDADRAADYLTKFAKLIRLVLERSGKNFITLEEELNGLQLYMDLEVIRFEKPFIYEINCEGIDITSVMIPSLLIQPFVENAIWHGLDAAAERPGKIKINCSLDAEILHCDIADNGVGLNGSMARKGNGAGTRKSFGIEITRQRLQLAGSGLNQSFGLTFEELSDEAGRNAGTCVHIDIPVKISTLE